MLATILPSCAEVKMTSSLYFAMNLSL